MDDKPHILIVDDTVTNLKYAEELLKDNFQLSMVKSGKQALRYMEKNIPQLVLLDVNMPEMSGYDTFKAMKEDERMKQIPVIFLTAEKEPESELEGFRLGAMDFITKPFIPEVMLSRISRIIELEQLRRDLEVQVQRKTDQLDKISMQSITTIAYTVDAKDHYSKGHSIRVAECAKQIAIHLGWDEKDIEDLYNVAILHDIGKIAVPDALFTKTGKLTNDEYEEIKKHTHIGGEILKDTNLVDNISDGANYHHEWYDGSGYHIGLSGEDIPIVARIIGIADAYDAMASARAYRKELSNDEIIKELLKGKGTQFDPVFVDILLEMIEEGFRINEMKLPSIVYEPGEKAGETSALLQQVFSESVEENRIAKATDSLTGFYNRRYFENEVAIFLLPEENQGAFFMMDLDNFKEINDTYGHIAGDSMIMIFADAIKENIRGTDYVCRIGGDEFAIFYPNVIEEDILMKKAVNIINAFHRTKGDIDKEGKVSVSIGISISNHDGREFEKLYNKADKALYYVKNNGKDDFHFYSENIASVQTDTYQSHSIDMIELMKHIKEKKVEPGAYSVEYSGFAKIYQFVSRYIERNQQDAQIILFSLNPKQGYQWRLEVFEECLAVLEESVVLSLRRGDVTTRFSSSQQIVILMDTNEENGQMVAERILECYNRICSRNELELFYDIQEVHMKS